MPASAAVFIVLFVGFVVIADLIFDWDDDDQGPWGAA